MNHISTFLNSRIVDSRGIDVNDWRYIDESSSSSSYADKIGKLGNFCLIPVRCLFKGNKVIPFPGQKGLLFGIEAAFE